MPHTEPMHAQVQRPSWHVQRDRRRVHVLSRMGRPMVPAPPLRRGLWEQWLVPERRVPLRRRLGGQCVRAHALRRWRRRRVQWRMRRARSMRTADGSRYTGHVPLPPRLGGRRLRQARSASKGGVLSARPAAVTAPVVRVGERERPEEVGRSVRRQAAQLGARCISAPRVPPLGRCAMVPCCEVATA